jgi:hypothetical protein
VLLVLLGLVFWALYALESGSERHSYAHGGAPPTYVQLQARHTYWVAIPGGVASEAAAGLQPSALHCDATAVGQAPGALAVTAEQVGTKATDQIGSFVAASTASVHVTCDGIGTVFVDDAADASFDWAGAWLVLAVIALTVGLPLTLSGLRRPRAQSAPDSRSSPDAAVPARAGGAHRAG